MRQVIHNISSILLAFLVLLSTVSFTVEKHFCGDILMDMAIMQKSQGCVMEAALSNACDANFEASSCCTDEHINIEGQDTLKLTWNSIDIDDQQFILAFITSYFKGFETASQLSIPTDNYIPPKLIKDVQLLNETFLI